MKLNGKILVAGLSIIILSNLIALGGVAYNRSGEAEALIELREREIGLDYRYGLEQHSTSLSLSFKCRVKSRQNDYSYADSHCRGQPHWLGKQKLIQLGFNFEPYDRAKGYGYNGKDLPRDVYVVLEYDGDSHRRVLAAREAELAQEMALRDNNPGNKEFDERVSKAADQLVAEPRFNSRLFAVDAGLDKSELRNIYLQTDRYIIMKAAVRAAWHFEDKKHVWSGRIDGLFIERINVPLAYRKQFAGIESRRYRKPDEDPRFKVSVAFGKRNEPWLVGVEPLLGRQSTPVQ
jgi:hypothetical protein